MAWALLITTGMCGWVMNRGQYEPFTDEPMYDSILPFGLKRRGLAAPSVPRVALTRALFHLDRASHLPADLARLRELRMVVEPRAKAVEEVAGKVAGKAGEVGEVLAARGEGGAAAEVQEGWFSGAGWETKGNLTEAADAPAGLRQGNYSVNVPGLEKPVCGLWTTLDVANERVEEEMLEWMWVLEGLVPLVEEAEKLDGEAWAAKSAAVGEEVWKVLFE